MSEETPTKKGGFWTEAEKFQLILSMLDSAGKVDWSQVTIPGGRSVDTARFQFGQIKKKAGIVANDQPTSISGTPIKRKRTTKPKDVDASDEDDEESLPKKRIANPRIKIKKDTDGIPAVTEGTTSSVSGIDGEIVKAKGTRGGAALCKSEVVEKEV